MLLKANFRQNGEALINKGGGIQCLNHVMFN